MRDALLSHTTQPGEDPGTTILKLVGPLTLSNLFGFQGEFRTLTPALLIVDMAGVPYMDSAGLGLLVNAHVSAENNDRKFSLANINDRVMTLLHLTKLDQVLKTFPSVKAAEAGS